MSFNRLFADDEELGKKDDDFRPENHTLANELRQSASSSSLSTWLTGPRMRRRRLAALVGFVFFAYIFIKNIPTDLTPVGNLVDIRDPTRTIRGVPVRNQAQLKNAVSGPETDTAAAGRPPQPKSTPSALSDDMIPAVLRGGEKTTDHYYDGLLRFYDLPGSLHGITHTQGYKEENKNVLFLAANAKSASRLIAVACDMAKYNRNHVHFAFAGRDPIKLDTLKELNGVDRECSVYWHDARPDQSEASTDGRMEYSVTSALYHVQTYMHPQVYFIDVQDEEERYFYRALQAHTARVGKSLIELPVDTVERMMWITRLDHASLAAWDTVYIDILIQVPPNTSGSLIRLLKSIQGANYFGSRMPHITVELPSKIEPATQRFLDNFIWPPLPKEGGKHTSQLTLRRRVPRDHLSPLEASVRTVESFYSARPRQSHVLVLSTQAELSPLYYHYLFYNTLEYGYSSYFKNTPEQEALMGIALDLPAFKLNGEDPLTLPTAAAGHDTPFYWQAPDAHAALYFGNKWQEFHDFLSRRLSSPHQQTEKLVSPSFPAFAEPMLELMRARCWFMLYPRLPEEYAIATIHNELSAPPEEYQPPKPKHDDLGAVVPLSSDTPYLEPVDLPAAVSERPERPLMSGQLVNVLSQDGDLPELSILPKMSWDAQIVPLAQAIGQAGKFAAEFHKTIGGCKGEYDGVRYINTVDDLFCDESTNLPPAASKPVEPTVEAPQPVRAGLEAIESIYGDKLPNAFKVEPEMKSRKPEAASQEDNDAADSLSVKGLADSGLVIDTSEPPSKPVGGGSSIRKGPAKDGVNKQGSDSERANNEIIAQRGGEVSPEKITDEEKVAMQAEFQGHLDRSAKSPARSEE